MSWNMLKRTPSSNSFILSLLIDYCVDGSIVRVIIYFSLYMLRTFMYDGASVGWLVSPSSVRRHRSHPLKVFLMMADPCPSSTSSARNINIVAVKIIIGNIHCTRARWASVLAGLSRERRRRRKQMKILMHFENYIFFSVISRIGLEWHDIVWNLMPWAGAYVYSALLWWLLGGVTLLCSLSLAFFFWGELLWRAVSQPLWGDLVFQSMRVIFDLVSNKATGVMLWSVIRLTTHRQT